MESVRLITLEVQYNHILLAKNTKRMYNILVQEREKYGKYIRRNKIYNEKIWNKS